jgi:hypothetical protein
MESNGQKAKYNGNGIHFNYTNSNNKTQEKINQETPSYIKQIPLKSVSDYIFKNSLMNSENFNKNEENLNENLQIPSVNLQEEINQSTHSENNQNSENFLLSKKRENSENDDEKNYPILNTMERLNKSNKIERYPKRLVVTRIKSEQKEFKAKSRLGNNENEISNFNRQGLFDKMNSTTSVYSVNCPLHHLRNNPDGENKKIWKKLDKEFEKNENNMNLNENENTENFGNFFSFMVFFQYFSIANIWR